MGEPRKSWLVQLGHTCREELRDKPWTRLAARHEGPLWLEATDEEMDEAILPRWRQFH